VHVKSNAAGEAKPGLAYDIRRPREDRREFVIQPLRKRTVEV